MALNTTKPLQVEVKIDSAHYVTFGMWYRKPGDAKWTSFAGGKDDDSATTSIHNYTIGPLPSGSLVHYFFHFAGNPKTTYKVTIAFLQEGQPVASPIVISGTTDGSGLAKEESEAAL